MGRQSTANIEIIPKAKGAGIEIKVKPNTKGEVCHIPVVVKNSGFADKVYNEFYIGEGADITIIAGCGIHNDGSHLTRHDGIHMLYLAKNSKVKYIEKHYGEGNGTGARVLNPETVLELSEGASLETETVQIEGVDSTNRITKAKLADGATLRVKEKLMTSGSQFARTEFTVDLNGAGSGADIVSRSVAKGKSVQEFFAASNGNNVCMGHCECDAIIMDGARVVAVPEIRANHVEAALVHEAAIGKIAGEQIIKLMSLGLTEQEAEQEIINGFLK
jgi:Fe-S cluster assembly scaffold protein SufB